jgi:hypothetical protein
MSKENLDHPRFFHRFLETGNLPLMDFRLFKDCV